MKALGLALLTFALASAGQAAEPSLHLDLGDGKGIDLILIKAGEFTQGSPTDEPGRGNDESLRKVQLSRDYYLSRTAVTRGQWERFVAETGYRSEAETGNSGGYGWDGKALVQRKEFTWRNPGFPQEDSHPVCLVTYPDAAAFCKWLERKSHRKTTLPTEAQWEYACRAGTTTAWPSGTVSVAWSKGNSGNSTQPAESNSPNAWGLVIGGNVAEWCLDWYAPYEPASAEDPLQDNPDLSDKPRRVLRGGSWNRDEKNTRSAARFRVDPRSRNADIGFRVAVDPSVMAAPAQAAPLPPIESDSPRPAPVSSDAPPDQLPEQAVPRTSSRPSLAYGIFGLACLLLPVIFIISLIRSSSRKPVPVRPPVLPLRQNRRSYVRTVDNGFWIQNDWDVGTPIALSYLLNGVLEQQSLIYQPASGGHFVFTGGRPDDVTVSPAGDPQIPPPLPLLEDRDSDTDAFHQPSIPSFLPNAY